MKLYIYVLIMHILYIHIHIHYAYIIHIINYVLIITSNMKHNEVEIVDIQG